MIFYLSFDVETDGPNVLQNSMISFGLVAYNENGEEITTFQRNIRPIDGHCANQNTMNGFWLKNPKAWEFVNRNQVSPQQFVEDLHNFITELKSNGSKGIVWMARPSAFDWMWLKTYYENFKKSNFVEIGHTAKCISTMFWMHVKNSKFSREQENELWNRLTSGYQMTHNPVDDARFQGALFFGLI